MWTCTACNEEHEESFDSCWKCGTGRDGTPTLHPKAGSNLCLSCGSEQVLLGNLAGDRGCAHFTPRHTRIFTLSLSSPGISVAEDAHICLNCGLMWSSVRTQEARDKIEVWGKDEIKKQLEDWRATPNQMLRPAVQPENSEYELLRAAVPKPGTEPRELPRPESSEPTD